MRIGIVLLVGLLGMGIHAQSTAQLPAYSELDKGWSSIATDGVCSSGTPYQFYVKPGADPGRLLIFFNGGGACWFGAACDLTSQPNIHTPFAEMDENNPANARGIFDFSASTNPFSDYAMVVLPYCTGDVHIGSGTKEYTYASSAGLNVTVQTHHHGNKNSSVVLDWVYANFLRLDKIVVSGSSAGAIGASFYSGLIADHYAESPTVLLADAAGAYGTPSLPVVHRAWDSASILPDWPEYLGETNETLSFEDFYIASANHNSNLTIAQYNTAEDSVQQSFTQLMGDRPESFNLTQRLLNNYQKIESGVESFYSYTAGGTVHTIMGSPDFYSYAVEGVPFVEWVQALIDGSVVADISCVNEAVGCKSAPGNK